MPPATLTVDRGTAAELRRRRDLALNNLLRPGKDAPPSPAGLFWSRQPVGEDALCG